MPNYVPGNGDVKWTFAFRAGTHAESFQLRLTPPGGERPVFDQTIAVTPPSATARRAKGRAWLTYSSETFFKDILDRATSSRMSVTENLILPLMLQT